MIKGNVLIGKCFGIGNAVMAIPMIKAFQSITDGYVDILVGDLPDDIGSFNVLRNIIKNGKIFVNSANERIYDLAIMAIPFDGRWKNGIHFSSKEVIDYRPRPDASTKGLISWKAHEVLYQMDNARKYGFVGDIPSCSFIKDTVYDRSKIYLGVGYKKDNNNFWKIKHWGNNNFIRFIKLLLKKYPNKKIIITGDQNDFRFVIKYIINEIKDERIEWNICGLERAFNIISSCGYYVGNDTGMMHVSASCDACVLGMFFIENSIVKNHPWCKNYIALDGYEKKYKIAPEYVLEKFERMLNGYQ